MNKKQKYVLKTKFYKIIITLLILLLTSMYVINNNNDCKVNKIIKNEIVNKNVVFLGDSITDYYDLEKYFPNILKVNSGIKANKTNQIKDDMYNRVYRYNPSKVILLIGINNYLQVNDSVDNVINDIDEITTLIEENLPNCKIYIESLYPINDDWRIYHDSNVPNIIELRQKVDETNNKLKDLCKNKGYKYIDMFSSLKDENNNFNQEYTDDGLHPNQKGYEIITNIIKKYL